MEDKDVVVDEVDRRKNVTMKASVIFTDKFSDKVSSRISEGLSDNKSGRFSRGFSRGFTGNYSRGIKGKRSVKSELSESANFEADR